MVDKGLTKEEILESLKLCGFQAGYYGWDKDSGQELSWDESVAWGNAWEAGRESAWNEFFVKDEVERACMIEHICLKHGV